MGGCLNNLHEGNSLKILTSFDETVFKSKIWKYVSLQDFYFDVKQKGKLIPSAEIVWILYLQAVSVSHKTD